MINVNHVSFGYGKKMILKDINLHISANGLTALMGVNGVGKSTLFSCLTKQNKVTHGEIIVNGKNINKYQFKEYATVVSMVPQLSSVREIDCKVRDFLVTGRTPYLHFGNVPKWKDYEMVEEKAWQMGVENYLDMEFSSLSGGQQQLILLTRAMVQDTPIILLDEPLSALDMSNQAFILKKIRDLPKCQKTVLFSTHNPNHALLLGCDVILMKDGMVLGKDTAQKCLTGDNLRAIFGEDVKIMDANGISMATLVI